MLAQDVNRALAGLQGTAFGHPKMALESTLRLHNDGAARRVSERIESCFHAQSKSQVFEDEVLPGPEGADHPPEEMPERHDHGKNPVGKARIKLCAKSFILQVYDVLASHSP
jgi:hypothetical protein